MFQSVERPTRKRPGLSTALPGPAPTAASGEATAGAARARWGEGGPEACGEVTDREGARSRAEIAVGCDPVDVALVVKLLGHVQLCALQHALGDAERDAVDEEPLPQLECRGRCLLQAREVREIAPERFPPLRLDLAIAASSPPDLHIRSTDDEHDRVDDRAGAERDEDDVAPARRLRA